MAEETSNDTLAMTVSITAAYVMKNRVSPEELPGLIASINSALIGVGIPEEAPAVEFEQPSAAQVRKSVSDSGIVSFLDGRTYQTMKRHLTNAGLTADQYRERYGLPSNYPMTAPAYSAKRSALAKTLGLGQKGRVAKGGGKVQAKATPKPKPATKVRAPKA